MKWTKSKVLLSLVLVCFFGFVVYEMFSAIKEEKKSQSADQILDLASEDVTEIEISYGGQHIVLKLPADQSWQLTEPFADLADAEKLGLWLNEVIGQEGRVVELPEAKELKWETYGLHEPIGHISFKNQAGKVWRLDVSAQDTFDNKTYIKVTQKDEKPKLYVGASRLRALLLKTPDEFQNLSLWAWTGEQKQKLVRVAWVREQQAFKVSKKDKKWKLTPKTIYPVTSAKIFAYLDDLGSYKAKDFIPKSKVKEVAEQTPVLKIEAYLEQDQDKQKQTLSFYENSKKNQEDLNFDFIAYNSMRNIWFGLDEAAMKEFNPSVIDLLSYTFDFDVEAVQQVLISNVGVFVKKNQIWQESSKVESKAPKGQSLEGAKVRQYLMGLNGLTAQRFESEIKPLPERVLVKIDVEGEGWQKALTVYNQVGPSRLGTDLEDSYLVVEPEKNVPFWVLKKDIEKLLLIEFYK